MVYDELAVVYDALMEHVPYQRWATHIRGLCGRHGLKPARVLDAACGTGRFLAEFVSPGQEAFGFDRSRGMLRVAQQRFQALRLPVQLSSGDLRTWKETADLDLVVCLYDSINYLLRPEHLEEAFRNLAERLRPGGLLIFDICTEYNSRHFLNGYREEDEAAGIHYHRHSWYDETEKMHHNDFHLTPVVGGRTRVERHLQRIYDIEEILRRLEAAPLEVLEYLDGLTLAPVHPESLRVHFVTRRTS